MSIVELILLGLALSMDAFAVTLSDLMAYPHLSRTKRILLPVTFGLFQGLMPLIGYFVGSLAADIVDTFAGPLALVLLGFIGGKMVVESVLSLRAGKEEEQPPITKASEESPAAKPAQAEKPAQAAANQAQTSAAEEIATYSEQAPTASKGVAGETEAPATGHKQAATLSLPALLLQGIATSIDALIVGISLLALGANIAIASSIIAVTTGICCVVALVIGKRLGHLLGDKAQIIGGIVLIAIGIKACFF